MMTHHPVPKTLGLPRIRQGWRRMQRMLAPVALVVAVVAAAGSTLIAQSARACEMKHHECHHTATITPCCCDHANDAANQGGPVESKIQLMVDLSALPLALAAVFVDTSGTSLRIHTSQPPAFPADLATRFAPLLV